MPGHIPALQSSTVVLNIFCAIHPTVVIHTAVSMLGMKHTNDVIVVHKAHLENSDWLAKIIYNIIISEVSVIHYVPHAIITPDTTDPFILPIVKYKLSVTCWRDSPAIWSYGFTYKSCNHRSCVRLCTLVCLLSVYLDSMDTMTIM